MDNLTSSSLKNLFVCLFSYTHFLKVDFFIQYILITLPLPPLLNPFNVPSTQIQTHSFFFTLENKQASKVIIK